MSDLIRILIADDHQLVRQGFNALLSVKDGIEIVGQAANGDEAVKMALSLKPDIILMDLLMPKKTGIEATREIKTQDPDARILIITSFAEDENVYQAIKAGALGYLLKDSSPQEDRCRQRPSRGRRLLLHLVGPESERHHYDRKGSRARYRRDGPRQGQRQRNKGVISYLISASGNPLPTSPFLSSSWVGGSATGTAWPSLRSAS